MCPEQSFSGLAERVLRLGEDLLDVAAEVAQSTRHLLGAACRAHLTRVVTLRRGPYVATATVLVEHPIGNGGTVGSWR